MDQHDAHDQDEGALHELQAGGCAVDRHLPPVHLCLRLHDGTVLIFQLSGGPLPETVCLQYPLPGVPAPPPQQPGDDNHRSADAGDNQCQQPVGRQQGHGRKCNESGTLRNIDGSHKIFLCKAGNIVVDKGNQPGGILPAVAVRLGESFKGLLAQQPLLLPCQTVGHVLVQRGQQQLQKADGQEGNKQLQCKRRG